MIPKIIHYCWFGRGEKSKEVLNYIESWKNKMPDYQVIEWNEDNFDFNQCAFSKEAYAMKKFAFVSDYARLKVLYQYGGIYMDVDMEVVKKFDACLCKKCFFGYESEMGGVASCVIGAEPKNELIELIIQHYESIKFVLTSGKLNMRPNTLVIQDIIQEAYKVILDGEEKLINDVYFYDWHVFHPLSLVTGKLSLNERTLAIHRHTLLWVSKKTRIIKFIRMKIFIPIFGEKIYNKIESWRRR